MSDEPKRPVILESLRAKHLLKASEITSKIQEALEEQVLVPRSDQVLSALKEHQDRLMRAYVETTNDFASGLDDTNRILKDSAGDNKRSARLAIAIAMISALVALASLLVTIFKP